MSKNSSGRCYQGNIKRLQKEHVKDIKIFLKQEKKKAKIR